MSKNLTQYKNQKTLAYSKKDQKLGLPKRTELKPVTELMKLFNVIHNHIYANQGLSPNETFNEILKLLFLKIQDEMSNDGKFVKFGISDVEYYQVMENKTNDFKKRIDILLEEAKINFPDVIENSESINLNESTLAFVVNRLQYFNLSKSKRDIKGTAFQKFIYSQQRGSRGQFLTPEPIIKLAVNMMAPNSSDKILDPTCGAAGFLVEAMNYVFQKEFLNLNKNMKKLKRQKFTSEKLFGIEINPTMIKVAKMRMLFENDGNSGIFRNDSLASWEEISQKAKRKQIKSLIEKDCFDLILTNPPFGTQGKISNNSVLNRFNLGHNWRKTNNRFSKSASLQNAQVPDILFLERCLDFLNENGRLAIVLPVGDLENKTLRYLRQYLLDKAKILAVISLPQETFIPFGTGVKTCILFLQKMDEKKLKAEIENDYKIFFSIIKNVGYEGNKNGKIIYKKNEKGEFLKDNLGNMIVDEDMTYVIESYKQFTTNKLKTENDLAFQRSFSQLKDRWDPEFYCQIFKKLNYKLKKAKAVPLRSIVKIVSNRSKQLTNKELNVRYVEISNVNPNLCELNSFSEMKVHELPSRASYEIRKGDIITAVSGISTGTPRHATALVSEEFDGVICTNGFRVLRPEKIDSFYLLSYLRSKNFLLQMLQYRTGAAIPAVNDEDLGNVLVILPPKNIQEKISKNIKSAIEFRKKSTQMFEDSIQILNKTV